MKKNTLTLQDKADMDIEVLDSSFSFGEPRVG